MALPDRMVAIAIDGFGGPDVLKPVTLPLPSPGAGEVLIEVAAAGVNRPDVGQRQGTYPPPPGAPDTPGLEVSGTVVAIGASATRYRIGDRVCALVAGGGYAQYCVAPEPQVLPIPDGLSFVEAAAIPETFFTVWSNVFQRGHLIAGESLLVHGGSSGIGTTAIQLGKAFGATVFTTVGSEEKAQACRDLGADHAILYREQDFVAEIERLTQKRGVDVVLDMVGGDYVERNLHVLAMDGRLVQIAWLDGAKVSANFLRLMTRRLTWTGATLRPRSVAEKGAIAADLERQVWPLLAAGKVRPRIDSTFPLAEAAAAHTRMEASSHIGKIVLEV